MKVSYEAGKHDFSTLAIRIYHINIEFLTVLSTNAGSNENKYNFFSSFQNMFRKIGNFYLCQRSGLYDDFL